MKKYLLKFTVFVALIAAFTSCKTVYRTMREPNVKVNLTKNDFLLSDQVSAEAKTVKIIGIDWARIFTKKTGYIGNNGYTSITLASIPVVGNLVPDKTSNYALYELMNNNPGYDVVFYPQYETQILKPVLGIGFFCKITKVKTIARLRKLNK